jgi:hypothetical protein
MPFNVELRERISNAFTNIIHVATNIEIVEGLLDGTGKFNVSLFPSSMLNSKKMAGPMSGTKTLAQCLSDIATYHNNETALYPGTYLIANGIVTINPSTDHYVMYGDDGGGVTSQAFDLENGDHLFYIKQGSENFWSYQNATLAVTQDQGVANLSAPYNTINGSHIKATLAELEGEFANLVNNAYGLVTGFRWVASNQAGYDAKSYKVTKVVSEGSTSVADASKALIPSYALWDFGQMSVALRLDTGVGYEYFVMEAVDPNYQTNPMIYRYVLLENKHMWGVINNNYPLATTENAGLMSASDKSKLNGLISNATHTGDVEGATSLTIKNNVVTFAKMQDVDSYRIAGRIADNNGDMKALTPAEVRTIINVEDNANNYSHPNHSGDVTSSGDGATTIANNAVTLAKMAQVATARILGRVSASTGNVEVLTKTQMLTFLNVQDGANNIAFATNAEMKTGTNTTKAMNPLETKNAVQFFGGMKRYGTYATDGVTANAAHPDGAIAMFAI